MNFTEECKEAILRGNIDLAKDLAHKVLDENLDVNEAIDAFSLAIREAGDLFEEGEFFLPELMRSAEAMKAAMTFFEPVLKEGKENRIMGKVVIGTIEGDIHDIGKTLVAAMLSAEGFEVHDLGADVPVSTFIEKAIEVDANLICISALLTTTMVGQKKLIDSLKEKNLRDRFKVLIGGAPVSKQWVEEIGADGSAENAISAVKLAKKLVES
ncbi:MAG: corrinoid protein [Candidatus Heimdallarchaeota archaeon]|nr:corrinoid protein [Candidatus Heimdallarchaeota archaeon]MCK4878349.1 corrinoid protein [Candidatus Heimdallarchaeota archaeon]